MGAFSPQEGVNIQDLKSADMMGHLYRVSEKIDGVRRIFYKNNLGAVTAFSRTFKTDPWVDHICKMFENNKFPSNTYYDCELVDRESYFNREESFELRTKTNAITAQEYGDNKKCLMAICFDFYQKEMMSITIRRSMELSNIFAWFSLTDPIIMVPILGNIPGENINLINKLADKVINQKGEGIMLQDCDVPYIQGRSKHLIKVKRKEEFIGKIVNVEMAFPGTKIEGKARSISCKIDKCDQIVSIGSGFTNAERSFIADYREELVGQDIEIEAFGISIDKNNHTSLSMPIFKRFCNAETQVKSDDYSSERF